MATVSPGPAGGGGGEEEEEVCEANNLERRGDDNDEEEDSDHETAHEEDHYNKKDKKKKKKKVRLMTLSGQSDAHRRKLRQDFRQLNKDIAMDVINAVDAREDNNLLSNDVRYTREAVLDSDNMDLITSKAAREAEKIIQIPRYDAMAIAQNLVKKGSTRTNGINQFNWQSLGFQVGVCFSALPSNCSFLYGPLDADYTPKERKKVERKRKAEVEEEEEDGLVEDQPEIMEKKRKEDRDGNELSAVERHIKVIKDTLRARTKEERGNAKGRVEYMTQLVQEGDIDDEELARKKKEFIEENSKVDAVKFLFNPNSFTQTVENISNFSFTVKEGIQRKRGDIVEKEWGVDIKARGVKEAEEFGVEPGPVVIARALVVGSPKPPPKQAIVALSMKDWRDICAAYSVEKSDLPHREKELATPNPNTAHSMGAEEGAAPQVSQDSYNPEEATQNSTNSLEASDLPQVSQDLNIAEPTQNNTNSMDISDFDLPQVSQESYAPRREQKQAEKARRAFCL